MKKEFLPKFVIFSIIVIILMIVITWLLGFEPNVGSTMVKYFIYAIVIEFSSEIIEEDKEFDYLYLVKILGIILCMIIIFYLLYFAIGKIFNLYLKTKGMASYTALIVGFMLGYKYVKIFKNKLFKEKPEEKTA